MALAVAAAAVQGTVITCSRLVLGELHRAQYSPSALPLCIQLDHLDAPGVMLQMSVDPPTTRACVEIEIVTAPRQLQQETRCFPPEGTFTMPLMPPREPHTYIILPNAGGERPTITTKVYALEEEKRVLTPPPSAVKLAASASSSVCPSSSATCASEEASTMQLCQRDVALLQGCVGSSNCSSKTIGCLRAHKHELQASCARAVEAVNDCCPASPPSREGCAAFEQRAMAVCANSSADLSSLYPQECSAVNCTSTAIGCLLVHKTIGVYPYSQTCQTAVDEVADCCSPPPAENRCSVQEDTALRVCGNGDLMTLQMLVPSECWATDCLADAINCLLDHQDLLQEEDCLEAVTEMSQCIKGAWDLLGPMVIAAYLLLATASVVLLCTMLRCCCRCVCATPMASLQDESTQSDDDAGTEDDDFIVTPLPSGVKQEKTQEEEDENALPGYSEVVEGATVLPRAPLQTSVE
jgi:hypothetical protein